MFTANYVKILRSTIKLTVLVQNFRLYEKQIVDYAHDSQTHNFANKILN